jgi:hypothetical protein
MTHTKLDKIRSFQSTFLLPGASKIFKDIIFRSGKHVCSQRTSKRAERGPGQEGFGDMGLGTAK